MKLDAENWMLAFFFRPQRSYLLVTRSCASLFRDAGRQKTNRAKPTISGKCRNALREAARQQRLGSSGGAPGPSAPQPPQSRASRRTPKTGKGPTGQPTRTTNRQKSRRSNEAGGRQSRPGAQRQARRGAGASTKQGPPDNGWQADLGKHGSRSHDRVRVLAAGHPTR